MAIVMERLTEILIDRYRAVDELEVDLSSAREDVELDSEDVCRGYAPDSLLHWPRVLQH